MPNDKPINGRPVQDEGEGSPVKVESLPEETPLTYSRWIWSRFVGCPVAGKEYEAEFERLHDVLKRCERSGYVKGCNESPRLSPPARQPESPKCTCPESIWIGSEPNDSTCAFPHDDIGQPEGQPLEADYLIGRCIPLLQILRQNETAREVLAEINDYAGVPPRLSPPARQPESQPLDDSEETPSADLLMRFINHLCGGSAQGYLAFAKWRNRQGK